MTVSVSAAERFARTRMWCITTSQSASLYCEGERTLWHARQFSAQSWAPPLPDLPALATVVALLPCVCPPGIWQPATSITTAPRPSTLSPATEKTFEIFGSLAGSVGEKCV